MRRVAAVVCLFMALGTVLPAHALSSEATRHPAAIQDGGHNSGQQASHQHHGADHDVTGHCSATGCFSALPSNGALGPSPGLTAARLGGPGCVHLSPSLKRDPPVPRLA